MGRYKQDSPGSPRFTKINLSPHFPNFVSGSASTPITTKRVEALEPQVANIIVPSTLLPGTIVPPTDGQLPIVNQTFSFIFNLEGPYSEGYRTVASIPLPTNKQFFVNASNVKITYLYYGQGRSCLFIHNILLNKGTSNNIVSLDPTTPLLPGFAQTATSTNGGPITPPNSGVNEEIILNTYNSPSGMAYAQDGGQNYSRFIYNLAGIVDVYIGNVVYTTNVNTIDFTSIDPTAPTYTLTGASATPNVLDVSFWFNSADSSAINNYLKGFVEIF